jgi:hypothetical protein
VSSIVQSIFITSTLAFAAAGCVTIVAPPQQSGARYAAISMAGTVVAEIDAVDGSSCALLIMEAVKKNPLSTGLIRCETASQSGSFPTVASLLDTTTAVSFQMRFRTMEICQKMLLEAAKPGSGVSMAAGCK